MIRILLLSSTLAAASVLAIAVEPGPGVACAAEGALTKQDRDFVNEAAMGGMLEVKLGELAQSRAASDDVRKFGQRMIEDHTKLDQKLTELATRKGMALPEKLDAPAQAKFEELAKLSGVKFDKAYVSGMVADHEHDLAGFEKEATAAKDPDLAALVSGALPTLQEHLALAKQVQAKVGK
jgi:putative membrane protein